MSTLLLGGDNVHGVLSDYEDSRGELVTQQPELKSTRLREALRFIRLAHNDGDR